MFRLGKYLAEKQKVVLIQDIKALLVVLAVATFSYGVVVGMLYELIK